MAAATSRVGGVPVQLADVVRASNGVVLVTQVDGTRKAYLPTEVVAAFADAIPGLDDWVAERVNDATCELERFDPVSWVTGPSTPTRR